MKITEVVISAGRTVSHPLESYANLRPQVSLKASIEDGEDYETVVRNLQAKAESMVEDHKNSLVKGLIEIDHLSRQQQRIESLERNIRDSQNELENLRRTPSLSQASVQ